MNVYCRKIVKMNTKRVFGMINELMKIKCEYSMKAATIRKLKRIIDNDLIFNSSRNLARFKALQCRESGSWLHAIPSPNIGTLLDNTFFQVCIGLRLGCNLCTPHICKCNAKVDEIGIHGLSCSKSSGRFSRHRSQLCRFGSC
jgi:hypothetical protein